jgi:hypothetical protein
VVSEKNTFPRNLACIRLAIPRAGLTQSVKTVELLGGRGVDS